LLEKAAKMLKPRGRIVYSTCSIEPAENENLVQKFMQKNRGFRLLKQRCVLPGRGAINELQAGEESLRHDGGYAAVLVSE
jgi:16S rRNA C967 or C1407 C5-methylase (RsmB/RsmF family)